MCSLPASSASTTSEKCDRRRSATQADTFHATARWAVSGAPPLAEIPIPCELRRRCSQHGPRLSKSIYLLAALRHARQFRDQSLHPFVSMDVQEARMTHNPKRHCAQRDFLDGLCIDTSMRRKTHSPPHNHWVN